MAVYRPHLAQSIPPASSWWVGLDRAAFWTRAREEFQSRMVRAAEGPAYSSPGSIVDQERIPAGWITRLKGDEDA